MEVKDQLKLVAQARIAVHNISAAFARFEVVLLEFQGALLDGWVRDWQAFEDTEGDEYHPGEWEAALFLDGVPRAIVKRGSGTGYNVAHVFDEDGNVIQSAELTAADGEGLGTGEAFLLAERAWCRARLAEWTP